MTFLVSFSSSAAAFLTSAREFEVESEHKMYISVVHGSAHSHLLTGRAEAQTDKMKYVCCAFVRCLVCCSTTHRGQLTAAKSIELNFHSQKKHSNLNPMQQQRRVQSSSEIWPKGLSEWKNKNSSRVSHISSINHHRFFESKFVYQKQIFSPLCFLTKSWSGLRSVAAWFEETSAVFNVF